MAFDSSNREYLEQINWDYVYPRLLRYATYKCKKFEWLGTAKFDPESMAHEAVALVFGCGRNGNYRNWNRKRYPDVLQFLEGVIDSLINHEYERTKTFKTDSIDGEEQSKLLKVDPVNEFETKENISQLAILIRGVAGDGIAKKVVACLEQGICKPREIADQTRIDVVTVYQILRRIRDRVNKQRSGGFS